MNKRLYPRFSKEFTLKAIRLAEEADEPIPQVARELGIRHRLKQQGAAAWTGTAFINERACIGRINHAKRIHT